MTQEEAEKSPAGLGREEPDPLGAPKYECFNILVSHNIVHNGKLYRIDHSFIDQALSTDMIIKLFCNIFWLCDQPLIRFNLSFPMLYG